MAYPSLVPPFQYSSSTRTLCILFREAWHKGSSSNAVLSSPLRHKCHILSSLPKWEESSCGSLSLWKWALLKVAYSGLRVCHSLSPAPLSRPFDCIIQLDSKSKLSFWMSWVDVTELLYTSDYWRTMLIYTSKNNRYNCVVLQVQKYS